MLKQTLLQQFNNCYDENGWFVALRNVLDGTTAGEALWKPDPSVNSIWQTLEHLTFYNFAYLQRFKGIDYKYPTDNNDETFATGTTEEEWQQAITNFDETMHEFRDLLNAADAEKLADQVSATNTTSWAGLIAAINAHNAYHGGQILVLRKLQGTWDPTKGVS